MRTLAVCLLLVGIAHADSSVPAAKSAPVAASCRWEDTPYGRTVRSEAVKQAEKKIPAGVYFMNVGQRHFLFGDHWPGKKPRTIVYDPAGERVVFDVAAAPAALVETVDGTLAGVLVLHKDRIVFQHAWGDDRPPVLILLDTRYYDSASVALESDGCTAYVALFDRIATGSALVSANLCTGALRWKADVVQLNVAHSKYFNDVTVEKRGGEILLHGVEAAGCYQQAFDAATGARKRSSLSSTQAR